MRNRLCQVAVTAAVLMLLMGGESFAAKRETKNEKSDTPGTPVPSAEEKAAAAAAAKAAKEAARKERGKKAGEDSVGPAGNDLLVHLQTFNPAAMRRAIADLAAAFGPRYPKAAEFLARLDRFEKALPGILEGVRKKDAAALKAAQEVLDFQREAMLANPLLDFDKLLLVRRKGAVEHGLPANWQGNCVLPRKGFDNEIAILSPVRPDGKLTTAYKPANESFVGDVDLHWDARKMLFSQVGRNDRWQIHEVNLDGAGLREITRGKIAEFDNYDPVYLPDDRIIFASASVFHGVPCVGGKTPVVNLFRMDADGENVRQLCFDQDHDWTPAVLNDGRVMYTRWEYADTPHYFTRLLFRMNPDGTGQMEYYGSNSFWPNSMFYARPVPGHPTMVAAIISGHHGVKRYGELLLFDPARGRQEARGVVQRIPGFGKPVEPVIKDRLVDGVFPRFLHPFPLSEKYLLVSAQLANNMPWGVYLVDVFDNMTLVKNLPGHALLEPLPLRKTPRPPVIVDRVDLDRKDAIVYLTDVYKGPGLAGVPRGSVRNLRVFEYHYAYNGVGGHNQVAVEGGWEVKRILGTVPVEPDGSASFRVPANTPLAVQPLDEKG